MTRLFVVCAPRTMSKGLPLNSIPHLPQRKVERVSIIPTAINNKTNIIPKETYTPIVRPTSFAGCCSIRAPQVIMGTMQSIARTMHERYKILNLDMVTSIKGTNEFFYIHYIQKERPSQRHKKISLATARFWQGL